MIKYVLFDLDGTLLGMNHEEFSKNYFILLTKEISQYGFDPTLAQKGIYYGLKLMIGNDGNKSNEEMFYQGFKEFLGEKILLYKDKLNEFYKHNFLLLKKYCYVHKLANYIIKKLKENNYHLILATNPIFPRIATLERMKWALIDENDFDLITTYEKECFCKPNLKYYESIINRFDINPKECLMIGNDVNEDMVINKLGASVFLLTNDLLNIHNVDINLYPHGDYDELIKFLNKTLNIEI